MYISFFLVFVCFILSSACGANSHNSSNVLACRHTRACELNACSSDGRSHLFNLMRIRLWWFLIRPGCCCRIHTGHACVLRCWSAARPNNDHSHTCMCSCNGKRFRPMHKIFIIWLVLTQNSEWSKQISNAQKRHKHHHHVWIYLSFSRLDDVSFDPVVRDSVMSANWNAQTT